MRLPAAPGARTYKAGQRREAKRAGKAGLQGEKCSGAQPRGFHTGQHPHLTAPRRTVGCRADPVLGGAAPQHSKLPRDTEEGDAGDCAGLSRKAGLPPCHGGCLPRGRLLHRSMPRFPHQQGSTAERLQKLAACLQCGHWQRSDVLRQLQGPAGRVALSPSAGSDQELLLPRKPQGHPPHTGKMFTHPQGGRGP